jgi:hypothetical protein
MAAIDIHEVANVAAPPRAKLKAPNDPLIEVSANPHSNK